MNVQYREDGYQAQFRQPNQEECCGIIIVGIGTALYLTEWSVMEMKNQEVKLKPICAIMMISSGILTTCLSFLGCCAAWKDAKVLILLYFSILWVLFLVMLLAGMGLYIYRRQVLPKLKQTLKNGIIEYGKKTYVTKAWDSIQRTKKCCGLALENNTVEWQIWSKLNPALFGDIYVVPASCCKILYMDPLNEGCQRRPNFTNAYLRDCHTILSDQILKHSTTAGSVTIAFSFCLRPRQSGPIIQLIRYVFILQNFILFCSGIVVLGLGVWLFLAKWYIAMLKDQDTNIRSVSSILMISSGILASCISFLGCCAVLKDNKIMILFHFTILWVVFFMMLLGGIAILLYKNQILPSLRKTLSNSIPAYGIKKSVTRAWDSIQVAMKCCGVSTSNNTVAWKVWTKLNSKLFNDTHLVPISCCKHVHEYVDYKDCREKPNRSSAYLKDCYQELYAIVKTEANVVGGASLAFACCVLICVFLSCILLLTT